ncbi:MAG TPA: hypothetical protein VJI97_00815 [Candidatus Nanoarchaeia archaeon]|nr:hypothetical protein [Candidatus Nanoarchaeia archaeon]
MEEEYNWELIMKVALPVSLFVGWAFYTNIGNFWKWLALVSGAAIAAGIVYSKSRRKGNVFTAAAVVFLVALVVKFSKAWGFI